MSTYGTSPVSIFVDSRIVARLISAQPGQDQPVRVLAEGLPPQDVPLPATDHPAGCQCGIHRGPIAAALDTVFLSRVRGQAPFFREIAIACTTEDAHAAVLETLNNDPVAFTRFRALSTR